MLFRPSRLGGPGDWLHRGALQRLVRKGSIGREFWTMCELSLECMEGEELPEETAQRRPGGDPPVLGPSSPVCWAWGGPGSQAPSPALDPWIPGVLGGTLLVAVGRLEWGPRGEPAWSCEVCVESYIRDLGLSPEQHETD